jgi:hypothetical protein
MTKYLFRAPLVLILGVLLSLTSTAAAQAATSTRNVANCSEGSFSQPFTGYKDTSWYTLLTGQGQEGFNGEGWTLSGGAKLVRTTVPGGAVATVLDLPSGSKAVSPVTCVTTDYPVARAFVKNVRGSEGVFFYVSYEGTNTWEKPKNTGQIHGANGAWEATGRVNLQPEGVSGWQPMRITLEPGGKTSEFQLYDLYLDPRMSR